LISLIAEKAHTPKVTVSTVLDIAMEAITEALALRSAMSCSKISRPAFTDAAARAGFVAPGI